MGKKIHKDKILKLFEESTIVDFKSIEKIVRDKKSRSQYAKQLVNQLLKQGEIKKISKGIYTKYDEASLAVFAFKPSYLGLQDALSFHNIWEQETIPIIITTRKVRTGIRKAIDSNLLIKKIHKKYMFGFEYFKQDTFAIPYSDLEKTFIDMVYFKQPISKEVLENIKKKIKKRKLNSYLKKYPRRFREKVMRVLR